MQAVIRAIRVTTLRRSHQIKTAINTSASAAVERKEPTAGEVIGLANIADNPA
jgi:hypothetical protein